MRLINADELKKLYPQDEDWEYPVNTNSCVCEDIDNQPTIHAVPIEVLQEIRQEIEANMESIIGVYGKGTPERDRPSAKIWRNEGRKECLDIIDKHIKELELKTN